MGINVTKARIPVQFEFTDESDSRFRKVKVWIAHTGENLNNSYFAKEVLEEMATTLPKIPIVGYIEAGKDSDEDFTNHRQEIVIKSGTGVDIRYAGHAYGFLPDDCNYQFELRDGKEWLTAEGYVWTKFRDAMEIFDEVSGIKSHSMEIQNAEGEVDDIGRMVYSSAVFSALCILGEDVAPAMTGSTIEFFNERKNQYQFELKEMIKEFESEKGELDLEPKDISEKATEEVVVETPEAPEPELAEVAEVTEEVTEEFSAEEPVSTEEVVVETPEIVEEEVVEVTETPEEVQTEIFSENEKVVTLNFQLTHDDQRIGLYNSLRERVEHGYHYIYEMYNDYAIIEQVTYDEDYEKSETKLLKTKFSVENDVIVIGEVEEVFSMYLTDSEKVTIDNQRAEIAELNSRLTELTEFKSVVELTAKEQLITEYAEELDEETVAIIKQNFSAMSIEDVEKEVALQYFKKVQAQKKETETTTVTVTNFSTPKQSKYGELDKYFQK